MFVKSLKIERVFYMNDNLNRFVHISRMMSIIQLSMISLLIFSSVLYSFIFLLMQINEQHFFVDSYL